MYQNYYTGAKNIPDLSYWCHGISEIFQVHSHASKYLPALWDKCSNYKLTWLSADQFLQETGPPTEKEVVSRYMGYSLGMQKYLSFNTKEKQSKYWPGADFSVLLPQEPW